MHSWLNKRHVSKWYGKEDDFHSMESVKKKYLPRTKKDNKTKSFIICHGRNYIGYIQVYKIADYPEYNKFVKTDSRSIGIDIFIGDENYLHKGYGHLIIRDFLMKIGFQTPKINKCIIGPEPKNKIAIKSYQKAGFSYFKTIKLPDEKEPEYLMILEKEVFDNSPKT